MNFENERIINSNGTEYRVGWDEHGWFTIQHGETMDDGEGNETFVTLGEFPNHSFTPEGADELIAAIKEGRTTP